MARKTKKDTASRSPHVAAALRFAHDVRSGKVPACRLTRLATERQLRDLERSETEDDYPFYFDKDAAERICGLAELMPHVKGIWARQKKLIKLEDWECFALAVPFGWKRKTDHTRRFRELYDCIPRKNGKSVLGAIIGDYMFMFDDEHGAEVYSGATTEKQAWEVFGPAREMLRKSPDICEEAGITVNARSLVKLGDGSKFLPLIGNPGDGPSPHCAIIDEFHEHQTSNQYDTMVTGMGARSQPMVAIITTAGSTVAGPCYDKHLQAIKVLEGTIENDELFVLIFTIDEDDDWADPKVLAKANPNFGVSVNPDFLRSQQRQAVLHAEYQNRFKTKHLNIWCSAKTAWMNMQLWQLCGDPQLTVEEVAREKCWFILDLASRNDICVFMKLFRKMVGDQPHYYAFGKYYLPEDTLDEASPNQTNYRKWADAGLLTLTDGAEINFDFIRDEAIAASAQFGAAEVVYDPWRAVHLAQQLTAQGATCVEYRQTVQTMSLPMKEFMSAVKSNRFHHDGNPLLTWMVSNVVAKEDAKENIYPRKEKAEMKIDGAVAIIMGIGRAMASPDQMAGFSNWMKNPVTA